jgi:hypothetical protein
VSLRPRTWLSLSCHVSRLCRKQVYRAQGSVAPPPLTGTVTCPRGEGRTLQGRLRVHEKGKGSVLVHRHNRERTVLPYCSERREAVRLQPCCSSDSMADSLPFLPQWLLSESPLVVFPSAATVLCSANYLTSENPTSSTVRSASFSALGVSHCSRTPPAALSLGLQHVGTEHRLYSVPHSRNVALQCSDHTMV